MYLINAATFFCQIPQSLGLSYWEHRTARRLAASEMGCAKLMGEIRLAIHEYSVRASDKLLNLGIRSMSDAFTVNRSEFPYFLGALCKEANKPVIPYYKYADAQGQSLSTLKQVLSHAEALVYGVWVGADKAGKEIIEPTLMTILGQYEKSGALDFYFHRLASPFSKKAADVQKQRAYIRAVLAVCSRGQREESLAVVRDCMEGIGRKILSNNPDKEVWSVIDQQEARLCALLDIEPASALANIAGLTQEGVPVVFSKRGGTRNSYCVAYQTEPGRKKVRYKTGCFVGTKQELLESSVHYHVKRGGDRWAHKHYHDFAGVAEEMLKRAVCEGKSLVEAIAEKTSADHPLRRLLPLSSVTPSVPFRS